MSAIEVLKIRKHRLERSVLIPESFMWQEHKALGEALLALEQKEKLKGWLEKEIVDCYNFPYIDEGEKIVMKFNLGNIFIEKEKVLKEVLEKVLGGKP